MKSMIVGAILVATGVLIIANMTELWHGLIAIPLAAPGAVLFISGAVDTALGDTNG